MNDEMIAEELILAYMDSVDQGEFELRANHNLAKAGFNCAPDLGLVYSLLDSCYDRPLEGR